MQENPTSMRVKDAGVRSLFTLESRWQAWLDVEAALAKAEAEQQFFLQISFLD